MMFVQERANVVVILKIGDQPNRYAEMSVDVDDNATQKVAEFVSSFVGKKIEATSGIINKDK